MLMKNNNFERFLLSQKCKGKDSETDTVYN